MNEPLLDVVSAVVLTYNEEENLGECLDSLCGKIKIFVVDSGSTDRTLQIAKDRKAYIVQHPYSSHASQWAWALRELPIETPWILALDADFVVSPELLKRMEVELNKVPEEVGGIYVRHYYRFAGGLIRFGGTKQFWLRLVRRGRAKPDLSDLVDFRFAVEGSTLRWREGVTEWNRKDDDISTWIKKQDIFALRLAVEEELRRKGALKWEGKPAFYGNTDQRIAWLRDRWLGLPLFVRPWFYFMYRYVLAGGFLDGRAGFLYHFLQGMWLRVLVDVKTIELRRWGLASGDLAMAGKIMLGIRSGSVRELLAELERRSRPLAGRGSAREEVGIAPSAR